MTLTPLPKALRCSTKLQSKVQSSKNSQPHPSPTLESIPLILPLVPPGTKPSDAAFLRCIGLLQSGNYLASRSAIAALVRSEPTNERAAALLELYKDTVYRDARQAAFLVAGAVAVGAAAFALYTFWSRGSSNGGQRSRFSPRGSHVTHRTPPVRGVGGR